jgi:NADPH-dependent 2,4-dienoyl-CoA reductase/sulfur reductase-like enzyme
MARPARFGPFHRRTRIDPSENEKVEASGSVWGRPRGNIYAGLYPAVKAWSGPLPEGIVGFEFYTDVEPDRWSAPDWPQWSEGEPGVTVLESGELVAISVIVTKRHDPE